MGAFLASKSDGGGGANQPMGSFGSLLVSSPSKPSDSYSSRSTNCVMAACRSACIIASSRADSPLRDEFIMPWKTSRNFSYPTVRSLASFAIAMSSVTRPWMSQRSSASRTSVPRSTRMVGKGERSAKSAGSSETSLKVEFGWNVNSRVSESTSCPWAALNPCAISRASVARLMNPSNPSHSSSLHSIAFLSRFTSSSNVHNGVFSVSPPAPISNRAGGYTMRVHAGLPLSRPTIHLISMSTLSSAMSRFFESDTETRRPFIASTAKGQSFMPMTNFSIHSSVATLTSCSVQLPHSVDRGSDVTCMLAGLFGSITESCLRPSSLASGVALPTIVLKGSSRCCWAGIRGVRRPAALAPGKLRECRGLRGARRKSHTVSAWWSSTKAEESPVDCDHDTRVVARRIDLALWSALVACAAPTHSLFPSPASRERTLPVPTVR
mmetsp:Transcript_7334/g.6413  ORF Transcript_7334/g.6413 Transcript_7334/m.6413 type:complete len:438 (+) Transcript_7334:571-1884(+)